jgi:hypothetical protein
MSRIARKDSIDARIDVEEFLAIKIRMELVFFGTILVLNTTLTSLSIH